MKTVIFDIGNVLIGFRWIDFIHSLFDDEETIRAVEDAMWISRLWTELDRGLVSEEHILQNIREQAPEYEEELNKTFREIGQAVHHLDYSIPWIKEIKAAGAQVLFLSNYSDIVRRSNPGVLDFIPYMDGGVFSYEAGLMKPDQAIYAHIVEKYQLDPTQCLFLDDNAVNVEAANAFGLPAVRFENYEQGHAAVEAFLNNEHTPFRPMRRIRQQLPADECIEILQKGTSGVLSVIGDAGYAYGVPVSYAYSDGSIHFHCAKTGHKIDAIRKHPNVSFTVIGQDIVIPERMTTHFRSVIAFGRARILEDPEEIRKSAWLVGNRYSSDYQDAVADEIETLWDRLCCVEIRLEHITGKESRELMEQRNHS